MLHACSITRPGCARDEDGLLTACAEHDHEGRHREYRLQPLLDGELDEVVRELAGRSPTRIERKPGATGTFAIAINKRNEFR